MPKMGKYSLEVRSFGAEVWAVVDASYVSEWAKTAKTIGGKWNYPFEIHGWQFRLPADPGQRDKIVDNLTALLDRIYGPQPIKEAGKMPEISLDRPPRPNGHTNPWDNFPQDGVYKPTPPTNGATEKVPADQKDLATKIARVVSKVVTENVERRMSEHEAKVDGLLEKNERVINSAIASSEFTVNQALSRTREETDAVNRRLDEVLRPVIVILKHRDGTESVPFQGTAHERFPALLDRVKALSPERRNILLSGPAGSGKTTMCRQAAEAMGLDFYFNGAIDSPYKLSGFIDAQGRIVSTAFLKAWKTGGAYLFDEMDGSLPGAVLTFNAALANGWCDFPEGIIKRHPAMAIFGAANTWGFGGTSNYVGRNKLDLASLDRFSKFPLGYDERLERAAAVAAGDASAPAWVGVVQEMRRLAMRHMVTVIVSPRRSINGAELLAGGISRTDVVESEFADLMDHDKWPVFGKPAIDFAKGA